MDNTELIINKVEEALVRLGPVADKMWDATHQKVIACIVSNFIFLAISTIALVFLWKLFDRLLVHCKEKDEKLSDEAECGMMTSIGIVGIIWVVNIFVTIFYSIPALIATDYYVIQKLLEMVK